MCPEMVCLWCGGRQVVIGSSYAKTNTSRRQSPHSHCSHCAGAVREPRTVLLTCNSWVSGSSLGKTLLIFCWNFAGESRVFTFRLQKDFEERQIGTSASGSYEPSSLFHWTAAQSQKVCIYWDRSVLLCSCASASAVFRTGVMTGFSATLVGLVVYSMQTDVPVA